MHRVEDAQPADEQRAEADQQQPRAHLAEHLGQTLAAAAEAADLPVGVGEGAREGVAPGGEVLLGTYPVLVGHAAAGLQQAGGGQRLVGDHQRRSAPVGAQAPVRLVLDECAHLGLDAADAHRVVGSTATPKRPARAATASATGIAGESSTSPYSG